MASWKKVIVSGSDASLGSLVTTGNIIATGSLAVNSTVKFPGLTNATQASIVGVDIATGQNFVGTSESSIYRFPGKGTSEYTAKIRLDYSTNGSTYAQSDFVIINI